MINSSNNGSGSDSSSTRVAPLKDSWQVNNRDIFRYRVKEMLKGDALIAYDNTWRIYCLPDKNQSMMYIVFINGEEVVRRKRLESVVDYLVANGAPSEMRFVPDGAFHAMRQYDESGDFIGNHSAYMPNDLERIFEVEVGDLDYVRSKPTNGVAKIVSLIYDEVVRVLVGNSRRQLFNNA